MPQKGLRLKPGTLWGAILRQTKHAMRRGALQPIETDEEFIEDGGMHFVVRVVSSLARKDKERKKREQKAKRDKKDSNPFLPYDQDLFVAEISDTHLALLNRFNVIDHHLLIVTRDFEDQETLLTLSDFEALWICMAEFEALGFYNGGAASGASQRHKHLQMVPLPLASTGPAIPIEALLESAKFSKSFGSIPGLPFVHAFTLLDPALADRPLVAAQAAHERYQVMLGAAGLHGMNINGETRQSAPYNLLITRKWMLLVPRSKEFFDSISVNALGFAGSLFVRNPEKMQTVRNHGPMTLLRSVAVTPG